MPELDGLRFFAFLLVFCNHMGNPAMLPVVEDLRQRGWIGVDLFFALSAYVLFETLDRAGAKGRAVSITEYIVRRASRIYPLMLGYSLLMIIVFLQVSNPTAWLRWMGQALAVDNIIPVVGLGGYYIPYTLHLWTLSFELQVYAAIPILFVLSQRMGKWPFLGLLGIVAIYATLARVVFYGLGATHPLIYYTPFLRPESYLAGMAIWKLRPAWHWGWSATISSACFGLLFVLPQPFWDATSNVVYFAVLATWTALLIDTVRRAPTLTVALSAPPLTFMGQRGYGLYVYHLLALALSSYVVQLVVGPGAVGRGRWWLLATVLGLGISSLLATLSFKMERSAQSWIRARFS